jgi:hypothetical protein
MKRKLSIAYFALIIILITLFNQFDVMKLMPLMTPEEFLGSQPYVMIGDIVMTQPSSSLIVYGLGLFIIALGIHFLRYRNEQESKKWWGYSMILWGVGTILAGTSYQAFGYQIKAVGHEYTNFTDWWEVIYLLLTGISISLMGRGMSYCIAVGKTRRSMQLVADASMYLYGAILLVGSIVPVKLLVTYELFNLVFMPQFIWFFALSIINYRKGKKELDRRFIHGWILFIIVNGSYYVYYWLGLSELVLDATNLWFNQNDVLHVMVFVWMAFIWGKISKDMKDRHLSF